VPCFSLLRGSRSPHASSYDLRTDHAIASNAIAIHITPDSSVAIPVSASPTERTAPPAKPARAQSECRC
jgi:hypothetical protein